MTTEYKTMTESKAIASFEEDLNECYGRIEICGIEFSPADVLKALDPTAYHCAFLDFLDAECIQIEGEG